MGKIKVLMIDDEEFFSDLVKMNLELTGKFEVRIAGNGIRGLRLAKEMKPHVILLDMVMPEMNGIEVLEELKKDAATVSIPIIMLTAQRDDKSKTEASSSYAEQYITKPVSADELAKKIEMVLKRRNG